MSECAFIKIEKPYEDDDYNTVSVLMDNSGTNVLLHEVEDSGCFDLEEYVDDINKVKTGYYFVDYGWYEETESWETPNIRYPVIDEWEMRKVWWGWFYAVWLNIELVVTRSNRYGY